LPLLASFIGTLIQLGAPLYSRKGIAAVARLTARALSKYRQFDVCQTRHDRKFFPLSLLVHLGRFGFSLNTLRRGPSFTCNHDQIESFVLLPPVAFVPSLTNCLVHAVYLRPVSGAESTFLQSNVGLSKATHPAQLKHFSLSLSFRSHQICPKMFARHFRRHNQFTQTFLGFVHFDRKRPPTFFKRLFQNPF
jgi:hypothetical protein